ncbi:AraC family transcriptional regulator [Actinospica sp.]|jgi:AraC-like DNA-binding protein|uniref:helix-turn-helix transcriptional regulator n=1 Tax=Actinospica sp. TaxID=1872142 RepID=UPI002CFCC5F5|nr:AraC family transcriptional regulator [Actinospica sp.]HWG26689.1 AraC family transcriptional regulator [Actinospica sp.]
MASALSGPVRFSTVGLPDGQRIARWEAHNADALIGLRCRSLDERTLEATEINLQLPTLHLARVIGPSHLVERTTEIIRRAPSDAFACYFSLVGEAFFYHDDGIRTLRPGQLVICDADRPFVRGFSRGLEELVVKVPRERFREATGIDSLSEPRTLDFAHGGDLHARTLARLVGAAVRSEGEGPVDDETLLGLLGALLADDRPGAVGAAHLAAAKTYVEEHLTESGLNAARIAGGVGISERHLSRVFAPSGTTVPQYVLGRRLERARTMLAEGVGVLSVAEVAAATGFGSAARFSHMFKERYGVRATDVLLGARAASASTMSKRTRDHA